jgi:hypothetical protein
MSLMSITIHCKLDDSAWYSATSAFSLCEARWLSACAPREMFTHLMTSHRANDLCAKCREIIGELS